MPDLVVPLPPAADRPAPPGGQTWREVGPEIIASCGQALRRLAKSHPGFASIGVTSTRVGEGRSTVATGLVAAQFRSRGTPSLLLDLDATPAAATPTALTDPVGSIDWVEPGLGRLAVPPDALAPAGREGLAELLAAVRREGISVVGDLPALPPQGDGDRFSALFDVVALVVRAGATPIPEIRSAAATLGEPPVVLLNRTGSAVPRWVPIWGGR